MFRIYINPFASIVAVVPEAFPSPENDNPIKRCKSAQDASRSVVSQNDREWPRRFLRFSSVQSSPVGAFPSGDSIFGEPLFSALTNGQRLREYDCPFPFTTIRYYPPLRQPLRGLHRASAAE